MRKALQTITAWRYPCRKIKWTKVFYPFLWVPAYITGVYKTKWRLFIEEGHECPCGKGCKPQKVRIVVEKL